MASFSTFAQNVGIGDATPNAKLNVLQKGSGDSFRVDDGAGDSTPFLIDTDGRVGIGDSVPRAKLHISEADDGNILLVEDEANDSSPFVIDSAGNVGIGAAPHPSAALDISSTSRVLLPPRMTTAQRDSIINPPVGGMIYNVTVQCNQFYDGSEWKCLIAEPETEDYTPSWAIDCNNIPIAPRDSTWIGKTPADFYQYCFTEVLPEINNIFGIMAGNWPPGYDTVLAIVTGVYMLVDHSDFQVHLDSPNSYTWPFQRWINFFAMDSGGIWCGNNSFVLSRALEPYYPVAEIRTGNDSLGSHQFNIVKLDSGYYPIDAMFGLFYIDEGPISMEDLIVAVKTGNDENFMSVPVHMTWKFPASYLAVDPCNCFSNPFGGNMDPSRTKLVRESFNADAPYVCVGARTTEAYFEIGRRPYDLAFEAYGDPIGVVDYHDAQKIPAFIIDISADGANAPHFAGLKSHLDSVWAAVPWYQH